MKISLYVPSVEESSHSLEVVGDTNNVVREKGIEDAQVVARRPESARNGQHDTSLVKKEVHSSTMKRMTTARSDRKAQTARGSSSAAALYNWNPSDLMDWNDLQTVMRKTKADHPTRPTSAWRATSSKPEETGAAYYYKGRGIEPTKRVQYAKLDRSRRPSSGVAHDGTRDYVQGQTLSGRGSTGSREGREGRKVMEKTGASETSDGLSTQSLDSPSQEVTEPVIPLSERLEASQAKDQARQDRSSARRDGLMEAIAMLSSDLSRQARPHDIEASGPRENVLSRPMPGVDKDILEMANAYPRYEGAGKDGYVGDSGGAYRSSRDARGEQISLPIPSEGVPSTALGERTPSASTKGSRHSAFQEESSRLDRYREMRSARDSGLHMHAMDKMSSARVGRMLSSAVTSEAFLDPHTHRLADCPRPPETNLRHESPASDRPPPPAPSLVLQGHTTCPSAPTTSSHMLSDPIPCEMLAEPMAPIVEQPNSQSPTRLKNRTGSPASHPRPESSRSRSSLARTPGTTDGLVCPQDDRWHLRADLKRTPICLLALWRYVQGDND
eukprot:Rmarinus@m.30230